MRKITVQRGFTLIELLIVITIIATLAVTVFVALNPAKRVIDSKNARRTTDVQSILTAIHTYYVDNGGAALTGMPTSAQGERMIGTGATCTSATTGCTIAAGTPCANIEAGLANYLKNMPVDPIGGTTYTAANTGYSVQVNAAGIITVKSCGAEAPPGGTAPSISAAR